MQPVSTICCKTKIVNNSLWRYEQIYVLFSERNTNLDCTQQLLDTNVQDAQRESIPMNIRGKLSCFKNFIW